LYFTNATMNFHFPSFAIIPVIIAIAHIVGVVDLNKLRTDIYNCKQVIDDVKEIVEVVENN
jgi:hypothetical protein